MICRLIVVIVLLQAVPASTAQSAATLSSDLKPRIPQPLPFKMGETLYYEIELSKFIFSGTIGHLTLSVAKGPDEPSPGLLELKAEVVSKGFLAKLAGLKIKDRYITMVNAEDFGLHSSTKSLEDGKVKRDQKSVIDRAAGRITYTERDLSNRSAAPKVKEETAPQWIQDLVSLCFFVRTQPLDEGDVIPIPITDTGQVYNIEVVVGKREEVKVDSGRFRTVMLDVKIFNGRYVKRSGELFIWVTDDSRRIPVKARIKTSSATATIEVKRMKNA